MIEDILIQWAKDAPALAVAAYVIFRLFNLVETLITSYRANALARVKLAQSVTGDSSLPDGVESFLDRFIASGFDL